MTSHLAYLLLGVGSGAAIALLGIGVVLTNRASKVVNFGHAAMGMWTAYVFYDFRETGRIALPIPYQRVFGWTLPDWLTHPHVLPRPTLFTALVIVMAYAALFGLLVYGLVFRRLRTAPPLGRVVASIGLFLYLYATAAIRFAEVPRTRAILPTGSVHVFGHLVFVNRLVIAAIAAGVTAALWVMSRFTHFGLATTAAAESEKGAALIGLNPSRLAAVNWMIASMLSGLALILIAPINSLDPLAMSLLVVPALAAALLGGLNSIVVVAVSGLAIGMLQAELVNVGGSVHALAGLGLQEGVPFLLILVALVVRGRTLPTRGEPLEDRLPESPEPRAILPLGAVALAGGVAVMLTAGSDWRAAVITSSIAVITSLSVVVLTGFVGQISLAPFAFAGVAAFSLIRLGDAGVPFPLAPVAAVLITVVLGVLVGVPAVRVRGMSLAIATLGAAVAIEQLAFKWSWFVGDHDVAEPRIGGLNLSVSGRGALYPRAAFGVMVVVVTVACAVIVSNLRRSRTGLTWLAVRGNERAAAATGINVGSAKLTAFAVSACLAGVAGVLTAYERQTVSETSFQVFFSLAVLAITYLMGVASVSGAWAAGFIAPLGVFVLLRTGALPTEVSRYEFATNGLLLMVVAVASPDGLTAAVRHARRWIGRRLPGPRAAGPRDQRAVASA